MTNVRLIFNSIGVLPDGEFAQNSKRLQKMQAIFDILLRKLQIHPQRHAALRSRSRPFNPSERVGVRT